MKTRLGRRWRARNVAARWFAPVPETVWMETALSWRLDAMEPKMRSFARLVKVGEPAMPRYSWVVSLRRCFACFYRYWLFYSAEPFWKYLFDAGQNPRFSILVAICSGDQ